MVDQQHRRIAIGGDIPRRHFDFQAIVRPIARFFHQLAGFFPVSFHVGIKTGDLGDELGREAPDALRRRRHCTTHLVFALRDDVDNRLAVERQHHSFADFGVVERRLRLIDDQVDACAHDPFANCAWGLCCDISLQRNGHIAVEGHVKLTSYEG